MSFRGRLVASFLIASATVGGGIYMERSIGVRGPVGTPAAGEVSGAWYCPHGGGEGLRTWVVAANPSDRPATMILTTRSAGAEAQVTEATLEPRTHRYFEVAAPGMASASAIEYFGAPLAAGSVVASDDGGVAAEPCTDSAGPQWYVAEGSSLRGQQSNVVVLNPSAVEAVVEVALVAGRETIRPGNLRGVVLEPGEVRAFDLNRFALGERALTASVTALLGRVAVGGVVVGNPGLRSVIGVRQPSRTWLLPGGADSPEGELIVTAPGGSAAPFRATAQGAESESPLIEMESVPAGSAVSFDVTAQDVGVVATAEGPQAFVAARRMSAVPPPAPPQKTGKGEKGGRQGRDAPEPAPPAPVDQASTAGAPSARSRWVVLPAGKPEEGTAALVLQNPGGENAEVTLASIGEAGPAGDPSTVAVPAGATIRLELPAGPPVTVLVEATKGRVVAAQLMPEPSSYALSVGIATD